MMLDMILDLLKVVAGSWFMQDGLAPLDPGPGPARADTRTLRHGLQRPHWTFIFLLRETAGFVNVVTFIFLINVIRICQSKYLMARNVKDSR